MASFQNQGQVQNQIGGSQNVQGSIYLGPVNHTTVYQGEAQRKFELNEPTSSADLDNEILSSLSFPQMLQRRANIEEPHENTCGWILDLSEYKSWASQPSGLLWIKGKPGSGKSTIMSFLYRRLEEQREEADVNLDFFFSARGAELQRTPLGMLRSLLNQLFSQDDAVRILVRKVYDEKCRGFGAHSRQLWEWQRPELESLLSRALSTSARHRQVNIFLDALDEAGERFAREIVRYFYRISDVMVSIDATAKICMSSRHYPIPTTLTRGAEISVENNNGNDIKRFVHDRLGLNFHTTEDYPDIEKWQELEDDLVRRANGIFQWVVLVVPILEQYLTDGDTLVEARQRIELVPEELAGVYEHILRKIIDSRYRQRSLKLFRLVCLASRPLSLSELRHALAVDSSPPAGTRDNPRKTDAIVETDGLMERQLKAWSGGLIEAINDRGKAGTLSAGFKMGNLVWIEEAWRDVNRSDRDQGREPSENSVVVVVQVIHQSVTDFILSDGLVILSNLDDPTPALISKSVDMVSKAHDTLYWTCYNHLASEDIELSEEPVFIEYVHTDSYRVMVDQQCDILLQYPFLLYATTELLTHAYLASKDEKAEHNSDVEAQVLALGAVVERWSKTMGKFQRGIEGCEGWSLMHMAASANLTAMLGFLTDTAKPLDCVDHRGHTPLHIAAYRGHYELVKVLVRKGADVNIKANDGNTSLSLAAKKGHLDVVRWLIFRDGGSRDTEVDLTTSLYAAVHGGFYGVAKLLIDAGVSPNDCDITGRFTALKAALERYHDKLTQLLIDAGVDVNARQGIHLPLQSVCRFGTVKTVQMLLNAGANVHAQGGVFGTALQAAVSNEDPAEAHQIVRFLLDSGLEVNTTVGKYGSALQTACHKSGIELVRFMVEAGANVHVQGGKYGTALQAAATNKDPAEAHQIVRFLLDLGLEVNTTRGKYGSALQAACHKSGIELVRFMVEAGANVHAQGGKYGTALQAAASNWNSSRGHQIVRFLLDLGLEVNTTGGMYGSALQAACRSGDQALPLIQTLLEAGADINMRGKGFGSPLQEAAYGWQSTELVKYLLESGADPNLVVRSRGKRYNRFPDYLEQPQILSNVPLFLEAGASVNPPAGFVLRAWKTAMGKQWTKVLDVFSEYGATMDDDYAADFFSNLDQWE